MYLIEIPKHLIRGKYSSLSVPALIFVREHGFEYINLKDEEDKKTTIKTALGVYGESFRKTKHPEVNLKKRNLYNILYLKYY